MSHIKLSELNFEKLKIAKSGKAIKLIYDKEPLQLVTELLYTPFGVKGNPNNYSQWTNYVLDCSLNQSNSENTIAYKNLIGTFDKNLMTLIKDNNHLFENTNFEELTYSPFHRENKTYPKLIKINLPRDNKGNFDFVIFNENKEKVNINENNITDVLCKGKIFKSIIECNKIWVYNGRFGTTWYLKQLRFINDIKQQDTPQTQQIEKNNYILLD